MTILRRALPLFLLTTLASAPLLADTPAPRRPIPQIDADLKTAEAAIPHYSVDDRLNPRFHAQMAREVGQPLRRYVDLLAEMEKADPKQSPDLRVMRSSYLAELALDGDADALKTLTDFSESKNPADAVFGAAGLLQLHWWQNSNPESQTEVIAQFQKLAQAHPRDDLLLHAALFMALTHAASDEVANSLRDVVEKDLHGPAAIKYQHQPVKFGRPFKVTVPIVGGKPLFIPSLKGKVVLIDFWATWCPGCRESLPHLAELYKQYHAQGLEVVGISSDYVLTDLKQFLAQNKDIVWPQSFSPAAPNQWHTLAKQCDVDGIPMSYLIDRNGILRHIQYGLPLDEMVQAFINQPASADTPPAPHAPSAPKTSTPLPETQSNP